MSDPLGGRASLPKAVEARGVVVEQPLAFGGGEIDGDLEGLPDRIIVARQPVAPSDVVSDQVEEGVDSEVGLAEDRAEDGAFEVARVDGNAD